MPFTVAQFFAVFAAYNGAIWPAIVAAHVLAIVAIALAVRPVAGSGRFIGTVLALFWFWMGVVYHWRFFTPINPAAWGFGALFLIESIVLYAGIARTSLAFRARGDVAGIAGGVLIAYALAIYPLLGYAAGHRWPAMPILGAPCPTTIFTFGMLLWVDARVPIAVPIIPLLWSLVASTAAVKFGVPQDFGLLVAGVGGTAFIYARNARSKRPAPERAPVAREGA